MFPAYANVVLRIPALSVKMYAALGSFLFLYILTFWRILRCLGSLAGVILSADPSGVPRL